MAADGDEFRLHLDDNGMLIQTWIVTWGDGSATYLRHVYQFDPIAGVTGVRVLLDTANGDNICIDELEVNSVPESGTLPIAAVGIVLIGCYFCCWHRWRRKGNRHSKQDEFIYILSGEPTLVTDRGEIALTPGMCAGFPAAGGAHQLVNRSAADVVYLEIGDRTAGDECTYPHDDLMAAFGPGGQWAFTRKDGTRY